MTGVRLGSVIRSIRIRRGWRQEDVARRAGVSRTTVWRIEHGLLEAITLGRVMHVTEALEIRLDLVARWRGGDLDRLMNAGHAAMHEQLARRLTDLPGWVFRPEVSYAVYGERGVIDILAFHPATGSLLVIELKTQLVDVSDLMGRMDRYLRLASRAASDHGWRATAVSCWIVLRDTRTNRRRVAAHAHTLRAAFPDDGRTARRWLGSPSDRLRALSFLSDAHDGSVRQPIAGVRRVRPASPRLAAADSPPPGRPTPG